MISPLKVTRWTLSAIVLATAAGLASCGPQTPPSSPNASTNASPAATGGNSGATISLTGAGSSFIAPVAQRWFSEYNKLHPNVQISYQSVGSGAGIKQFLAKTLDFAASDAPLSEKDRAAYPKDLGQPLQIPMVSGSVVFAYNLDGVDQLKLSRDAYCGIADGTVKKWNDPKIAKDNPGAKLPDSAITFVHRSDGSGTTYIFTNHIKAACPDWKAGSGKSVEWPVGVGGKGNEGVTAQLQQTKGAIGYVEYAYAKENSLKFADLQNKAGEFITATPDSAAEALKGAKLPPDFAIAVPNPDGKGAYPIVGFTWVMLYGQYADQAKANALKDFIQWAYKDGAQYAKELNYVPISDEISSKAVAALENVKVASK